MNKPTQVILKPVTVKEAQTWYVIGYLTKTSVGKRLKIITVSMSKAHDKVIYKLMGSNKPLISFSVTILVCNHLLTCI